MEQRSRDQAASIISVMKTLVQRIQETMDRVEQGVRVVEIVPVSSHSNSNQGFGISKRGALRRSEAADEMQAT
jgi:predicted nuclease with RNAse H fold